MKIPVGIKCKNNQNTHACMNPCLATVAVLTASG
jgi:hypothetical protein